MAKDNKVSMPQSTAGITRFFDEYKSKLEISPGIVIVMILVVIILMVLLHMFGTY
jgi:preprotein translocase subunit Sec61beta